MSWDAEPPSGSRSWRKPSISFGRCLFASAANLPTMRSIVYPLDLTYYHSRYTTDALRHAIDRDGVVIYDRASDPLLATAR